MPEPAIDIVSGRTGACTDRQTTADAVERCNALLRKNHETHHMFFRDTAGHNHIVHSLLTLLALGAGPEEIQGRYEDGVPLQRAMPAVDEDLLARLGGDDAVLLGALGDVAQYHTFLAFFKRQMEAAADWRAVVQRYVFARTPLADALLARLFEGAYHPVIHLGLGVEFQQPALVAEALAQAAAHDDSHIGRLFAAAEAAAAIAYPEARPPPLAALLADVRASDAVRTAPRWADYGHKMRDGVVGRAGDAMAALAARFRIPHDERALAARTAEMASTCAFMAGAAQRPGRAPKIDFFHMHAVTSSLFFTVLARQDWIALADRVRLVEWKGRLDLAWYAVAGSAPLDAEAIAAYASPAGDARGWAELFRAACQEHDDGHVAKFLRALKSGEETARAWEGREEWAGHFPVHGDMWLRLARMCHDTTVTLPPERKWVMFTGFDQAWARPDLH